MKAVKDPLAFARRHPRWVIFKIGHSAYRWIACAQCRKFFWLCITKGIQTRRIKRTGVYCSEQCSALGAARLSVERQKRWQDNFRKKHGVGYHKLRGYE